MGADAKLAAVIAGSGGGLSDLASVVVAVASVLAKAASMEMSSKRCLALVVTICWISANSTFIERRTFHLSCWNREQLDFAHPSKT